MTALEDNYKISLACTHLKDEDEQTDEHCYDIAFIAGKGMIELLGSRRVLFSADAFGDLRNELIKSLGQKISRQILLRFGYECGIKDGAPIGTTIKNKDIGILLGTFFHRIEGIVLAKNKLLEFFQDGKLKRMQGNWLNSYEVEQHLRHHGPSQEPICWSLAGYASGFASSVLGEDLLCIETECVAMGAESCTYEIRPQEQWPQEIHDKWFIKNQSINIDKDLSRLLDEERLRIHQRKLMQDCFGQLYAQTDNTALLRKFIYYVHSLVRARYTVLFNTAQKNTVFMEDYIGDETIYEHLDAVEAIVKKTCYFGEAYLQTENNQDENTLRLVAVPITINQTINNVAVILTEQKINFETIEKVKMLSYFCGIKYEMIHTEIQQEHLHNKLEGLQKEQDLAQGLIENLSYLQEKVELLFNCILEGKGITALINKLGEQTQTFLILVNDRQKLIASNLDKNRAKKFLSTTSNQQQQLTPPHNMVIPLLAVKRKLGELWVVERHKVLQQKEILFLETGAKVLSLELLKEEEAQLQYRFNFFELLVSGKYSCSEVLITQANKVGFQLDGTYQLLGLALENVGSNTVVSTYEVLYHQVRNFIKAHSAQSKVLIISNHLIIFLSYQDKYWSKKELDPLFNKLIADIKQTFPHQGLYFVAGRVCKHNLGQYPPAFREIKTCLSIMTQLRQRDRVVYIENLGVLSILFDVDQNKLINFVNDILGTLVDYDEKNSSELLPTLSSYVKSNFNIQLTARNNFMSSSTLKYRLRKIREYMNLDFEDPDIRLRLQLAFKLTEY